jgi:alpha-N-arabinofuranosidase
MTPHLKARLTPRPGAEPISPYIYSQFIEHLGRCIYGGIWAEMLEDRKFFDAVGAESSPWKPIGGAVVEMETEDPFVGDHTPAINLPGGREAGISQAGLSLIEGKEYEGRVWLSGDRSAGPVTIRLAWDGGSDTVLASPIGEEWVKVPLVFTAGATTGNGRLEIVSSGSGRLCVGAVSLMPADNILGMRPDTLELLKDLDAPLYRWPGGNFVSGYDWRDGIGDPDRRPPRKNPAWRGIEHNDFGIHEFMDFCELLDTEPLIVVNTGFGDAASAAAEVEYANGTANTPMGQWRAANGNVEPWDVQWWGIGNEMFGKWQLGYMALEQYCLKANEVEKRMREVDPGITTIGVGDHGTVEAEPYSSWSEGTLKLSANHMDHISEHFYRQEKADVVEHVLQIPEAIRDKVEAHRKLRRELPELKGKDIRIIMDEWNYWYGPEVFGELGTRYFMKDALGIAAGLHEYYRQSDMVLMANYAQTVNVIGCIKTTPTRAAFETTGLVLKLYRAKFGRKPMDVAGDYAPVDIAAALTEDDKTLTIGIVNPLGEARTLSLDLGGLSPKGSGTRSVIAADDPMAYNDPEEAPKVEIVESAVDGFDGTVAVAPYSVTLLALDL